ncbi:MAG: DUF4159 domain-containing protein [Paracoccus sp. (in: a-proteobacteria)]
MMVLGPIGFGAPLLLMGLAALPVLWWLMRVLPPLPRRIRFPGVLLLVGLQDPNPVTRRTPWWLLLLRMMAMAVVILAAAQPIWRPSPPLSEGDALLIVMDAGATAAPNWVQARIRATRAIETAISEGRPVGVLLADGNDDDTLRFGAGNRIVAELRAAFPQPWPGAYPEMPADQLINAPEGVLRTLWFSDGLDHPNRAGWLAELTSRGPVGIVPPVAPVSSLYMIEDGTHPLLEVATTGDMVPEIIALGPDPQGIPRQLARLEQGKTATWDDGIVTRPVRVDLPPELLGRVTRFEIADAESAASVVLGDDRLRRPVVALISDGHATSERQALLSPAHFLRNALSGSARVVEAGLDDALVAQPDVIILIDRAGLPEDSPLADWVSDGGMLIRFAGPRMASDAGLADEPLLPVRLRPGGRDMGGALSWGEPRQIAPFPPDSPFVGLIIPEDVTVRAQLMAEPSPDQAERNIAMLSDGTPLVSRASYGDGKLVLFHTTANADWSSLPISGLFVSMMGRLIAGAGRPGDKISGQMPDSGTWLARQLMDGYGRLSPAIDPAPVEGERLLQGAAPGLSAGIYVSGEQRVALNAGGPVVRANWPGARIESGGPSGLALAGWLFLAAALFLVFDLVGSLALRRGGVAGALLVIMLIMMLPEQPKAQDLNPDLARGASEFAMGYVLTGDEELDGISRAGLTGLSQTLTARTTVEPTRPIGIDIENDDLSLMTFLYWPVGPDQPMPSVRAYLQLNRFLRGGGLILFDTRDADLAGAGPDGSDDLHRLAGALDIPPLQLVPQDHVLTRSFYLLDDMPGRYAEGDVWVEAAAPVSGSGLVNDGVSPVVIGGNAWAEAWAIDDRGLPLYAVGVGLDGEKQREMAHRFGVNLIMYVLTGNYKSDQIHVPDLLDRLRQEDVP